MKKTAITSTVLATAFSFASGSAQAEKLDMEKCQITGYNRSGQEISLIQWADCKSDANSTCAGANPENKKDAWLYLPKGCCNKIRGCKVVSGK